MHVVSSKNIAEKLRINVLNFRLSVGCLVDTVDFVDGESPPVLREAGNLTHTIDIIAATKQAAIPPPERIENNGIHGNGFPIREGIVREKRVKFRSSTDRA